MRVSAIVSGPMAATESSTRAMAALDDLYRRHVGDVYRYTYAVLGNHADAEDVTQTTFVNALRALERGERPREPSHWLLAIAHNLVRQRWRQAAARPTMVELVNDVPEETPEEDVQLDELVRALQRIPPSQREALVMRELEGRPYREIAELLGMSTSALETLLFRARRSLAEELENLVTCQSAELALSRQSDGRISRKERRRLDAHVAECPSCARFSQTQARQRKAFKGLAVLPVPVGLALFKDAPIATAATVSTIGESAVTAGAGASGAAGGGATAGGSITVGGTVAGGSVIGGAVVKIAAIVAAASVVVGVGYQGVKGVDDRPSSTPAASGEVGSAVAAPLPSSGAGTERPGSTVASRQRQAGPVEMSDPVSASERKGALPVQPGDAENLAPATDGPPADGGVKDVTAGAGGTAGSGGAPESGSTPEAPASPVPASSPGDDDPAAPAPADDGGPTASAPPTSEPVAQPKTKKPRPTKASKPKVKKPNTKPPKAKGQTDGTPRGKAKPTADGSPAAGSKKPSDPPAAAPAGPAAADGSPPPSAEAPVAGDETSTAPTAEKNEKSGRGSSAERPAH